MQRHPTKTFVLFNGGLNLNSDEENLAENETANMQNAEIRSSGLRKMLGWEEIETGIPDNVFLTHDKDETYRAPDGNEYAVFVSYPDIILFEPTTGSIQYAVFADIYGSAGERYNGWRNTGDPIGRQCGDYFCLTDGFNRPILLDVNKVFLPNWKPDFTFDNFAPPTADPGSLGNLHQSYLATADNPINPDEDIGFPSFSFYHKNRLWVNDLQNPRRLYASKASNFKSGNFVADMFEDNDPDEFNIAFFVDVPTNSDIVGSEVISSDFVVVYCKSELHILKGNHPPGIGYPQPLFDFDPLNEQIGAISQKLIVRKGDNDHYFVASDNTIQTISNIEQSLQVKPKSLSNDIYPVLRDLKPETLARGYLTNHRINGELLFAFPSKNNLRYPDVMYILNYTDGDLANPPWSRFSGFQDLRMRGFASFNSGKDIYAFTENKIYRVRQGIAIGGLNNRTYYRLPAEDFGRPQNNKRIIDITYHANSTTGATIRQYHLWQDRQSGSTDVVIPQQLSSNYGEAIYGQSRYASKAGQPFTETKVKITNRVGKVLKLALEHNSTTEFWEIAKIVIRYEILGQRN